MLDSCEGGFNIRRNSKRVVPNGGGNTDFPQHGRAMAGVDVKGDGSNNDRPAAVDSLWLCVVNEGWLGPQRPGRLAKDVLERVRFGSKGSY